jgi:hypothetical protein
MSITLEFEPILTFKTAKGSQYWISEEGFSQRNKSYHPEHGHGDQGMKEVYNEVLYLDSKAAEKLGWGLKLQGDWWIIKRGQEIALLSLPKGSNSLRIEAGPFKYDTQPQMGLSPLELQGWIDWREWGGIQAYCATGKIHLGNKITEVKWFEK